VHEKTDTAKKKLDQESTQPLRPDGTWRTGGCIAQPCKPASATSAPGTR